jgi:serine/threonine-protein kinase
VSVDLHPGAVLDGRYRIEGVLGSGGMGQVVAAEHLELKHKVAIKVLHAEISKNAEAVARFMREARATARLRGDKVGRVLDVARLTDGTPYMAMELLEGVDLGRLLHSSGPLQQQTAVDYILQACEALAEAHRLGMVHRDLKPSNLFLTQSPNGLPLIKILDFGIAKATISEGDAALTNTNVMVGSPTYVSPEQMRSAANVDTRSDIWSLGVTLYELLAGSVPFPGNSVGAVLSAIAADPPVPLQRASVAPELAQVVLRCLEKDPNLRFANLRELAGALGSFASAEGKRSVALVERFFAEDKPASLHSVASDSLRVHAGGSTIDGNAATVASDPGLAKPRRRSTMPYVAGGALVIGSAGLALWFVQDPADGSADASPPSLTAASEVTVAPGFTMPSESAESAPAANNLKQEPDSNDRPLAAAPGAQPASDAGAPDHAKPASGARGPGPVAAKALHPKALHPRAQQPRAQQPRAQQPKAQQPKAQQPRAQQPQQPNSPVDSPKVPDLSSAIDNRK